MTTPSLLALQPTFAQQQAACLAAPFPSAAERKDRLKALKRQLLRYQDVLIEAIDKDFGGRAAAETKMLDILPTTLEINHAITHLRRWMRPSQRHTELLFISNSLQVSYQPKGVVGVIATWNFPVYLALGPMAAALAAGNRVMLRMPDNMPRTTVTLRQLLAEVFPPNLVAVFGEEQGDPNDFTALPFNHIVFTGSPAIGRVVMGQAAKNLTPVTLELGGKSPAVVLPDYPVRDAAKRIAHGKGVNCGQICVAPDYALVPRAGLAEFVQVVQDTQKRFYGGNVQGNAEYTSVVNARHAARLRHLLDDARAKGAKVIACGPVGEGQRIPLHLVTDCRPDMALMQEEIFGPILPVIAYDTLDEVLREIHSRPRPLALYCFSHDAAARQRLLTHTHSGGVTLNDWGWHFINHDAPCGGVGNSGMGTYHGEEGFRELSHARTVFKRHRWFPIDLFYPPYGNIVQHLSLALFTGKGDPHVTKPF
ncbi:MAG: coniferyl aldehyde dehydrogenase [Rhodoferax sp.]|nr:MAG: coniferyl aldehyde dehydrogenase [Rhodoferax sp.]